MLHPQYSRGTLVRNFCGSSGFWPFVLGVHYNDKFSGRDFFLMVFEVQVLSLRSGSIS